MGPNPRDTGCLFSTFSPPSPCAPRSLCERRTREVTTGTSLGSAPTVGRSVSGPRSRCPRSPRPPGSHPLERAKARTWRNAAKRRLTWQSDLEPHQWQTSRKNKRLGHLGTPKKHMAKDGPSVFCYADTGLLKRTIPCSGGLLPSINQPSKQTLLHL